MPEDDFMELGSSGLVPRANGWYYDKVSECSIDPEGRVFDKFGECVYDPTEEDEHRD